MPELPAAICGYPLPGWRLNYVKHDEQPGQLDGWIVSLKREGRLSHPVHLVVTRSTLGPLEAWDEALCIATRADAVLRE